VTIPFQRPPVAVNPLPWFHFRDRGIYVDRRILKGALADIADTPFRRVQADYPADMPVAEYLGLVSERSLIPAPGYFSAHFQNRQERAGLIARAKAHGQLQARLGNTTTYIAAELIPERLAAPAVGVASSVSMEDLIDGLAAAAATITAQGVRPCLHQHVGSPIETEAETRAVLDGIDPDVLWFGPDTGHLFWAGADVVSLFRDYAGRVAGVHLKDVHAWQVTASQAAGEDFGGAIWNRNLWTEPGLGDVPLDDALAQLPATFNEVMTVEVDRPDGVTPKESTLRSAIWVTDRFGQDVFAN
jgi:inosose dehydratase